MKFRMRIRASLLILLTLAAAKTGYQAYKSLQPVGNQALPGGLYERFSVREGTAEYCLKSYDGFVAVYSTKKGRTPISMTAIEVSALRRADKAMLERGIPVDDDRQLLELLEDLGS